MRDFQFSILLQGCHYTWWRTVSVLCMNNFWTGSGNRFEGFEFWKFQHVLPQLHLHARRKLEKLCYEQIITHIWVLFRAANHHTLGQGCPTFGKWGAIIIFSLNWRASIQIISGGGRSVNEMGVQKLKSKLPVPKEHFGTVWKQNSQDREQVEAEWSPNFRGLSPKFGWRKISGLPRFW